MTNSGYAERLKTERQELAGKVQLLVSELDQLDTDLTRKSPKQLERAMADAKRMAREIGSVEASIEDRLAEFEKSEERGDKARQRFQEDVERKTPMGGLFGKK